MEYIQSKELNEIFSDYFKESKEFLVNADEILLAIIEYYEKKYKYGQGDPVFSGIFFGTIKPNLCEFKRNLKEISYRHVRAKSGAVMFSKKMCSIFDEAVKITKEIIIPTTSKNEVQVSHLVLAMIRLDDKIKSLMTKYHITESLFNDLNDTNFELKEFANKMMKSLGFSSLFEDNKDIDDGFKSILDSLGESSGFPLNESEYESTAVKKSNPDSSTPMLDKYAKNMNDESDSFDPVIGRNNELEQLLKILGCKKKRNAILLGESGVGKTSVVELLAYKIKKQEVPMYFLDKKIYSLNLNSLVAGTKYRGQYEERLQGIIEEVTGNPNIIVFIDEIHNLIGNGSSEGNGDAANILKPYLAKGTFQVIGSTTFSEYRRFIEKDGALKRRFQTVQINEPSLEDTKIILKNIKSVYEKHHNVLYSDEVIEACVNLSERYITDRFFPDKAIDALDLCGSFARIAGSGEDTKKYLESKSELERLQRLKIECVGNEEFEKAIKYRDESQKIEDEMSSNSSNTIEVTMENVFEAIGKQSGVPLEKIGSSDLDKLRKLNVILKDTVIGQESAIKEIVMSLQRNSLGLRDPKKPIASLLFVGPTGSGKTYLCQTLAKEFFGSSDSLIKFDMAEFGEKHEITKLTGASASYVGYNDEPLFEQVRKKPYSVVLFDEIEKAAPEIFQIFLSILDEGYVTLGNGTRVNFKNTIIVFTGNIGTKELQTYGSGIGFSTKSAAEITNMKKDSIVNKAVTKTFAPEFINRLSKTVVFNNLCTDDLMKICDLEINKLSERLKTKNISLLVTDNIKKKIIESCDLKYGARDLQRNVTKFVEEEICSKLLEETVNDLSMNIVVDLGEKQEVVVKL